VGRRHVAVPLDPHEIVRLEDDRVVLLDQRRLPREEVELVCRTSADVADAIRTLAVRGAPAIGVAAAMGYALAAGRGEDLDAAARVLIASRPTAVNLSWAIAEMRKAGADPAVLARRARALHAEEVARCVAMSDHALELFPEANARALTHCNTGALATGGHGSALGAVTTAFSAGRVEHVYVDETRPLLQGSRLTAWELQRAGVPHTVVVDAAAATLMAAGEVTHVVVGADRIAVNGDVANKIGTYALAVLAAHHRLAFVVVAPTSTIDPATSTGAEITVEQRSADEVTDRFPALNPAFDVTPAALVTAIVTELGVHRPPYSNSLRAAVESSAAWGVADGLRPAGDVSDQEAE
jgi:methylthioribose-1-phosphate isomerase